MRQRQAFCQFGRYERTCALALAAFVLLSVPMRSFADDAPACDTPVARVVSVEGTVELRRSGEVAWRAAQLNQPVCKGDSIRTDRQSRAGLRLKNEITVRLDQNTALALSAVEAGNPSVIDLARGLFHVITRYKKRFEVITPFMNASVEGTEFAIGADERAASLKVFEGRVSLANGAGRLLVVRNETAIAAAGEAPRSDVPVRASSAVAWALYYPAVVSLLPVQSGDIPATELEALRSGDTSAALAAIEERVQRQPTARNLAYQAQLLLRVGRDAAAEERIGRILALDPANADALALRSIVETTQGDTTAATDTALRATQADGRSASAWLALSYAQQAAFRIEEAAASAARAAELEPGSALAWARVAELALSTGDVRRSEKAAGRAVALDARLARTQEVLGFAKLLRYETAAAEETFRRAIVLDPSDPLARLGLGLALIRSGRLADGRAELEVAVSLDPANSLLRSYAGKAYFEEDRDALAAGQFGMARELDPRDPTPWYYDAVRKQAVNDPVGAQADLSRSIELNDNRAVFRSRLLLDDDIAARGASLAGIYERLGFDNLALTQGVRALDFDAADYSAHRFLADAYLNQPRAQIVHDSELLQAQLLQPVSAVPAQPHLSSDGFSFLDQGAFAPLGFNEYSRLFSGDRIALEANALAGTQRTFGSNLVLFGVADRYSYSVGNFRSQTEGYRTNEDFRAGVSNALVQVQAAPDTKLLAEFRTATTDHGDPQRLFFDRTFTNPTFREHTEYDQWRLGVRQNLAPESTLLATYARRTFHLDDTRLDPFFGFDEFKDRLATNFFEVRHIYKGARFGLSTGVGYLDGTDTSEDTFFGNAVNPVRHANAYTYATAWVTRALAVTVGASYDKYKDLELDLHQFNPKLAITWALTPDTTLRAAAFRVLKRTLVSNQTLEPAELGGFTQFFDDTNGTRAKRYGIGVDHAWASNLWIGAEAVLRETRRPPAFQSGFIEDDDFRGKTGSVYVNWLPSAHWSLRGDYRVDRWAANPFGSSALYLTRATTDVVHAEARFFAPGGAFFAGGVSFVRQSGNFLADQTGAFADATSRFATIDCSAGYQFPKRRGFVALEARNLLDRRFAFEEFDPLNPRFARGRTVIGRIGLQF